MCNTPKTDQLKLKQSSQSTEPSSNETVTSTVSEDEVTSYMVPRFAPVDMKKKKSHMHYPVW